MVRPALVLLVLLVTVLAGCAKAKEPAAAAAAQGVPLHGVVVTQAIVPIAGASVTANLGGLNATTDATGQFDLGNVPAGSYQITVHAFGYADTTVQAQAGAALVKVVMVATRTDVPYTEVEKFDGYLECTFDTWVSPVQIIGAPCVGIADIVTGQQVSQDNWQFEFQVAAPGLKGLLAEMVWDAQPTGSHMGMLLRNIVGAGGGVDAGDGTADTDIQFASARGPSPLQMWVYQGIENPGANEGHPFQVPQNDTMSYKLLILGRADYDKQADVQVMVENHPQVFVTKFFNAIGDPSYSILNQA